MSPLIRMGLKQLGSWRQSIENWNDPYEEHYQVMDWVAQETRVYEYLYTSLYIGKYANVKGFRLDALRHMENDFLRRLSIDLHSEVQRFCCWRGFARIPL